MDLTSQLKEIISEMEYFVDAGNPNGFYKQFVFWVCKTWSTCEYIDTEVVDVGYDCSSYPVKTGLLAANELSTYQEFINSNTGRSECTFESGSGMRCEAYTEQLFELYGDACAERLQQLFAERQLKVPDKYRSSCSDISDFVFCEVADYKEDPELYDVCESINSRFGSCGCDVDLYMCAIVACIDNELVFAPSKFGEMTLNEFKQLMLV